MNSEPIKAVIANISETVLFGENKIPKKGTKHFRGGAKVFVIDAYWGACNSVTVVGHHRSSGRYSKIDMPVKYLDNFRMGTIYSPKVLDLLNAQFTTRDYTEDYAIQILKALPEWKEMWT